VATPQQGLQDATYLEEMDRRVQQSTVTSGENQTADILRYTESDAGDPSAGISPTAVLVSGLTNLPVAVSELGREDVEILDQNGILLADGMLVFDFLDLPAAGGVAANKVILTDVVSFLGDLYRPVAGTRQVGNDTTTGRSRIVAKKMGF